MRTALRLSVATLIGVVTSNAVAHATKYNFKGEVVPEPTTAETLTSWIAPENVVAVLIAFVLPGMPKSVFWLFAGLALYGGWKMAVCLCFGYYLLGFLMGGSNDAYE
jgi:hypothetical protein